MRALILHGPGDLRLEDRPAPLPAPGEVVLEVEYAMTCATDAKMLRNGCHPALPDPPAPFGHEATGRIAAVGAGVEGFAVGDAVVVANSAPCGGCFFCGRGRPSLCESLVYLSGAFAERLRVPARIAATNMLRRPASLDPRLAPMVEPLACAIRGVERSEAGNGDTVVILGGGVQGQFLTACLARRGCRVVVCDPHEARRALASRFGAAEVADAPRDAAGVRAVVAATPGGRGADVVFEAVGRPETWQTAVALARPGGEVNLYGGCPVGSSVTLPTEPLHYGELRIQGSYHHTPTAVRAALAMLAAGEVPFGELVGETVGLEDVPTVLAESGAKRPVVPGNARVT
jgi:L-iditol 2-dehydrogenase